MQTVQAALGFDTSEKAKFRHHILMVFYESGWNTVHLSFPNLSRATLYRWKKQYERSGKNLLSLVPLSTRPRKVRAMQTPLSLITLISELRHGYPRMGKAKVKRFTDEFCKKENLKPLSVSVIGKVIKRNNLFFAGKDMRTKKRLYAQKQRIKLCPKPSDTKPGYIQLDGLKFYYLERYYYFLTAVDIVSKQAWVTLVPSLTSKHARDFLSGLITTSWYKIHTIQTDNGSEFKLFFDQAVLQQEISHLWSYPRHPKTNGFVERLNWTVQDEFLFTFEDYLLYPDEFKEKLKEWNNWYNQKRPHQSLKYLSPYENFMKGGLSQKY